jgi:hypothetical protein
MKIETLDYKMHLDDPVAYIITVKNNKISEELSLRCQKSCKEVNQPFVVWDAFDGTDQKNVFYPEHLKDKDQYKWLKQMNNKLTIGEIAAIFSHFSLWCQCVTVDLPIVILEHDAIMLKKYSCHDGWNQINYLGNLDQYQKNMWPSFPPHSAASKNWRFICRAHAYAVDPASARQLISHVIRFGISAPADMLVRADLFSIVQTGFYAFDLPAETTIHGRNPNWEDDSKEIFSSFI